jgi:pimeloyl-ACP methyl ester carboxylesterase
MTLRRTVDGPFEGVQFVVDEHGQEDGPIVVWLHSEWGVYDDPPLAADILDSCRVLVIHHPGWGESTGVDHFPSLTDLATAYWWILDQCAGSAPVLLAGHGIGATIAAEMGAQQPERVKSLVLAAPFGIWDDEIGGVDFFALLPKDLMPHMYADTNGAVSQQQFPPTKGAHQKGVAGIRRAQTLGPASRYLYPLPDTGIARRLYRLLDTDVELVWGRQDGLVPVALAARWQAALPSLRVTVVDAAAHMVPYESNDVSERVGAALAR